MAEALTVPLADAGGHEATLASGDSRIGPRVRHVTTLVVESMHCGGCIRTVEQALGATTGVISARANLSTRRVSVETSVPLTTEEPLLEALAAKGFKATRLADVAPDGDTKRDNDLLRRLGVAGFAGANIMLLSVAVWSGEAGDMPASQTTLFHWLSALIALPAIAYAGQPFFGSARRALSAGRLNMDVPISLGVLLAAGMSLYQTTIGRPQVYFDAAVALLFFLLIGRVLDSRTRARATQAARNLLGARATSATVIRSDGTAERVTVTAVAPGMRLLIAAGENVPIDARIVAGDSAIDESLITGESLPREVSTGDHIYAGTINLGRPVEAVAMATDATSLLAELGRMMAAAGQARGRYVRLADRAAQIYAPAVHLLGLATFAGWWALGAGWEQALTIAIAVLIITCPCALALAVPVTQVVAVGRLFRLGVIIKAADGLERLADIDTVVLDKTGTLTYGKPRLVNASDVSLDELSLAASVAIASRHIYARAIVQAARSRGIAASPVAGTIETAGAGLLATIAGREVRLGSASHCGVDAARDNAATLWLAVEGAAPIAFHFRDEVRRDAATTIAALRSRGVDVEVLSGDRPDAVKAVADSVGIANWAAAKKPDEKVRRLDVLKSEGRHVLMVGDGLNDAPALASGHASMSPSTAADITQTAADAIMQGEAMLPIVETLDIARAARRLALENFAIAIGYNIAFVPLAIVGLVTPLIAAIAMSASSIAVTLNALRLSRNLGVRR